jgi:hypothetical protein
VELVRDEDDRPAVGRHRAHRLEERLRLLRGEHRGRLVQDQDPAFAVERLENLHPLLLADRELPDLRAGMHSEAVAGSELGHPLLDLARPHDEPLAHVAVVAEHDVLRDREGRDQTEVLVHHEDPRVERVARRVEADRLAVQADLAVVRAVQPREDVRERALAGAVLAEQRVHLARRGLEVDAVVRDDAREALRDATQRHGRARRGGRVLRHCQPAIPCCCR